jgi:V8-like Glu-specific endopeptidase
VRRIPRSALGALLAVGTLLTAAVGAAPAGAAPADDRWTPERMRAAVPLGLLSANRAEPSATVPSKGEKAIVDPLLGPTDPSSRALPEGGAPWTGGGDVAATSGRVFFNYDGKPFSCSGNAVTSDNSSTVITAGHCVKMEGSWHTDWVFVPGYHDGQAPYGQWTASETMATPQWVASEDFNYDIGAAVVEPLNGKLLTDVVGGQGLAFNTGYNLPMYAFGYPAAAPYDGETLSYCSGPTSPDLLVTNSHGLNCSMTSGSSGGPWFTKFDETTGRGLQASVNSFGYPALPNTMFGPYFGDDAQNLYEKAQSS